MNRDHTHLTCCALIASACTLAAALAVTASQKDILPAANAEMALTINSLSFLTTTTDAGVESLFVLDSASSKLMAYKLDYNRKRIELMSIEDLKKRFGIKIGAAGGAGDKEPVGRVRP